MLGFLGSFSFMQGLVGGPSAAVGVDLGTETLRLAQVEPDPDVPELVAAAARDVPPGAAEEPVAFSDFCAGALKELWREGRFSGRRAVLGVPSSMMHLLHLRLPKLDAAGMQSAMAFEAAGKLPFDPVAGILRHHVVGDVYTNDGPRQEVICTAVRRDHVELLLNAAEKARLDVAGLVAAPMALRDCFSRIYRRATDVETGFCFVDIGRSATRVTIMRAGHLYFARSVPIGSEDLNKAVADAVGVQPSEARLLRSQLAEQQSDAQRPEPSRPAPHQAPDDADHSFAMLGAALKQKVAQPELAQEDQARTSPGAEAYVMRASRAVQVTTPGKSSREGTSLVTEMSVAQAIDPIVHHLADEIQRCRRYHEGTFPGVPVDRLVFVGGEAHVRSLCQALARRLGISAQLGDPILGLCHDVSARRETPDLAAAGIDRRRPQPAWAVACGLSLGAPA